MSHPLSVTAGCLLAALSCAAPMVAQRDLVLPSPYARIWGRGSSSMLGGSSTRTQLIFAQPFAQNTPVLGVGIRHTGFTTDRAAFVADVEVQASSTSAAPGALSSTFANNIGSDVVVAMPRQMVNIPAAPANRSAGLFARFMFAAPFVFGTNNNTNINIDVLVYGRSAGAAWSTDRCFASANGMAGTAGRGCGSATIASASTNGSYVGGSTIDVTLSGATPSSAAFLLPSVDLSEIVPGLPLPVDLGAFGAGQGCDLMVNPLLSLPLVTDGTGAASAQLTVPPRGTVGTGWQWLYQVPTSATNPLGLETTAVRRIFIGPEVCVPIGQYVWDLSNVNSPTGNSTTDSVPVTLFILP